MLGVNCGGDECTSEDLEDLEDLEDAVSAVSKSIIRKVEEREDVESLSPRSSDASAGKSIKESIDGTVGPADLGRCTLRFKRPLLEGARKRPRAALVSVFIPEKKFFFGKMKRKHDAEHTRHLEQILQHFACPITLEIPRDPVTCEDGHTYDRHAILGWLANNNTSPESRDDRRCGRLRM